MEANETNGKEVENNAVRPKSDMDVDEMTDREIVVENNAVRHKCDMDAEAFDEVAKKKTSMIMKMEQQQQKNYLK